MDEDIKSQVVDLVQELGMELLATYKRSRHAPSDSEPEPEPEVDRSSDHHSVPELSPAAESPAAELSGGSYGDQFMGWNGQPGEGEEFGCLDGLDFDFSQIPCEGDGDSGYGTTLFEPRAPEDASHKGKERVPYGYGGLVGYL